MTRVLVVEDSDLLREALSERLSYVTGIEVVGTAADGSEAVDLAGRLRPDVIIMDVQMPVMDGIEATRAIRRSDPSCQVVAHTAFEDGPLVSEMIRAGAKAYLLKGGQPDELLRAIESVAAGHSFLAPQVARPLVDDLETLYRREQDRSREQEALVAQLHSMAITDYLTGLGNHHRFHARLDEELARAAAGAGSAVAVVRINVDDFHLVNNRCGHAVGDAVLSGVGVRIQGAAPSARCIARIGGEEFGIVVVGAQAEALSVAERAVASIRSSGFGIAGQMTASAGVAVFPDDGAGKDRLLDCTEQALRVAKARGKDCVVAWAPGLAATATQLMDRAGQMRAVVALARAVDARDPYTGLHSQRLARYARAFALGMGIHGEQLAVLRAAALLHDVGKIGVRDAVLRKPTHLDAAEYGEMKEHPVLGERIVLGAVDPEVSRAIRHHHERIDGGGYPDGLRGDGIPLVSRLLLVADAFDAMTSDRIYRKALPLDQALDELRRHAGTQFDPDVVGSALALVESGAVDVLS